MTWEGTYTGARQQALHLMNNDQSIPFAVKRAIESAVTIGERFGAHTIETSGRLDDLGCGVIEIKITVAMKSD